jgi:hypothetical protein
MTVTRRLGRAKRRPNTDEHVALEGAAEIQAQVIARRLLEGAN